MRSPVLLLASTLVLKLAGQSGTCTTVADGPFTAPAVWDCGCSPLICDSLVIAHTLVHTGPLTLWNGHVRVQSGGALEVSDTLRAPYTVLNEGEIEAPVLVIGDSALYTSNSGGMEASILRLNADSTFNGGSILATDTLSIGLMKRFVNTGYAEGDFIWSSYTTNSGELRFEAFGANGDVRNTGLIRASRSMVVFDTLYNDAGGYLDVDSLLSRRLLWNNSFMNVRRWLCTHTNGVFDTGGTGQAFCNGNFYNYGVVKGDGDLCIAGNSVNYGDIVGSPDICDESLITSFPPYLDFNIGIVGPNVNWCPSANCSTLGIATSTSTDLLVSPNPVTDRVRIEGLTAPPRHIALLDLQGRGCTVRTTWNSGALTLERDGLPAGLYLLRVTTLDDAVHQARIVMAGP